MDPRILVHGGAGGWHLDRERLSRARAACEAAAFAGHGALSRGGSALDAVEAAVRLLEDEPLLNAGRGSYPKTNGIVEMDALVMDGATLSAGAVAAIQRVRNPVSLARRVMTDTPHVLLVGEGASAFADAIGFPRCTNDDLLVARAQPAAGNTVGAVAIDAGGHLAAATSTGGVPRQMPGRVGDSPLVGCGAYADDATAGVSATGAGEALMKVVISKQVCDYVAAGMTAQQACAAAIALLGRRFPGAGGGLIAIDRDGRLGVAFDTPAMPYAWVDAAGRARSASAQDALG
jgi:beta-aspartyl-peptidase (threonine type)